VYTRGRNPERGLSSNNWRVESSWRCSDLSLSFLYGGRKAEMKYRDGLEERVERVRETSSGVRGGTRMPFQALCYSRSLRARKRQSKTFPVARGRGFLGIVVWAERRHRALGGEKNPGDLVSGRGCSPQIHSSSGLIWRKFSARQTNVHSPDTFFSPLKLNCRKPSTDLTQPLTGSTMLLRLE
jgi:hypothetical protein